MCLEIWTHLQQDLVSKDLIWKPTRIEIQGPTIEWQAGKMKKGAAERDDITREPLGGGGWPTLGRVCCNRGEGGEQGEQSEQEWVAHREMKQFKPLLQTWEGEREILPHTTQCTAVHWSGAGASGISSPSRSWCYKPHTMYYILHQNGALLCTSYNWCHSTVHQNASESTAKEENAPNTSRLLQ